MLRTYWHIYAHVQKFENLNVKWVTFSLETVITETSKVQFNGSVVSLIWKMDVEQNQCRVINYHRILLENPISMKEAIILIKMSKWLQLKILGNLLKCMKGSWRNSSKMRNKGLKLTVYLRRRRIESQPIRLMVKKLCYLQLIQVHIFLTVCTKSYAIINWKTVRFEIAISKKNKSSCGNNSSNLLKGVLARRTWISFNTFFTKEPLCWLIQRYNSLISIILHQWNRFEKCYFHDLNKMNKFNPIWTFWLI